MSDHTPPAAGSADEPTARQPAVPPEPEPAASAPPPAETAPPPPAYAAAPPPPRQPWRNRRVPLLVVVGALLLGCLCGAGGVATIGLIARFTGHDGDRVRVVERDGGPQMRPGQQWRDSRRMPDRVPGPAQSVPAPPAQPTTPGPVASS